jgi:hypothetical protein
LEEKRLQLDQDPQVRENVGTPVADGDRRRQIPDSSVQDPDYKTSNSPRFRRELATTPIAPPYPGVVLGYSCRRTLLCKGQCDTRVEAIMQNDKNARKYAEYNNQF